MMLTILAPLATVPLATLAWIALGLRRVPMDVAHQERDTYRPRHAIRTTHRGNPLPAAPHVTIRPEYVWINGERGPRTFR